MDTEKIKSALAGPRLTVSSFDKSDLLSSGSTLLNLACTGRIEGAFVKGKYFFLVGDSQSGKTFLSRTCLAEATINPKFKDYRLLYDDVEGGALMDTRKYFGDTLADRLEAPAYDEDDEPMHSVTVEDFYFNLDDALNHKRPCIYVLDSQDCLSSDYEGRKFDERKTASRKGTKARGDYGDGKPKIHSSGIRSMLSKLRDTGSILIVISQTRDKIDAGPFQSKKTRSGGHALTFYAMLEIWFSTAGSLDVTVRGKERKVGIISRARVKKNRATGRDRVADIPIYYSLGIDDVGGMVDYLVAEKRWKKSKAGVIDAEDDLDIKARRNDLIQTIEDEELEFDLKSVVKETWEEIEGACEVRRKPRYS